jgi:hypothetical protein
MCGSESLRMSARLTNGLLLLSIFCTGEAAVAQQAASGQSAAPTQSKAEDKTAGNKAKADAQRKAAPEQARKGVENKEKKAKAEPSEAYKESIRQTVERRRVRRMRRQGQAEATAPVGGIVPWPMPPALIIRHTRDVHDDIGAFLYGLRY